VPEFVEPHHPLWQTTLEVKPGITNLAALVYRNEEQILALRPDPESYYRNELLPSKLKLDADYLRRSSWSTDLKLLFMTICYSAMPARLDPDDIRKRF